MSDKVEFIHNLSWKGAGQRTSSTCWLASYRMLYKWGNDTSDPEGKLRAARLPVDDMLGRGIYPEEFPRAAHALGLNGLGVEYIQRYSWADLCNRLQTWGPFWCAIDPGGVGTPTHAVVVYGASERVGSVLYMDPWSRPYDGDANPRGWSLPEFKDNLTRTSCCVQMWP